MFKFLAIRKTMRSVNGLCVFGDFSGTEKRKLRGLMANRPIPPRTSKLSAGQRALGFVVEQSWMREGFCIGCGGERDTEHLACARCRPSEAELEANPAMICRGRPRRRVGT